MDEKCVLNRGNRTKVQQMGVRRLCQVSLLGGAATAIDERWGGPL